MGRCPLELAQGPSSVAPALHFAGRSIPFGVTTEGNTICALLERIFEREPHSFLGGVLGISGGPPEGYLVYFLDNRMGHPWVSLATCDHSGSQCVCGCPDCQMLDDRGRIFKTACNYGARRVIVVSVLFNSMFVVFYNVLICILTTIVRLFPMLEGW